MSNLDERKVEAEKLIGKVYLLSGHKQIFQIVDYYVTKSEEIILNLSCKVPTQIDEFDKQRGISNDIVLSQTSFNSLSEKNMKEITTEQYAKLLLEI